jgi:hypothetical protein
MGEGLIELLVYLYIVVAVAAIVRRLRPAQRWIVLGGATALLLQAWYPPCISLDGSVSRRWMEYRIGYIASSETPLVVDTGQQTIGFAATIALVVIACLVLEQRHRTKAKVGTLAPEP